MRLTFLIYSTSHIRYRASAFCRIRGNVPRQHLHSAPPSLSTLPTRHLRRATHAVLDGKHRAADAGGCSSAAGGRHIVPPNALLTRPLHADATAYAEGRDNSLVTHNGRILLTVTPPLPPTCFHSYRAMGRLSRPLGLSAVAGGRVTCVQTTVTQTNCCRASLTLLNSCPTRPHAAHPSPRTGLPHPHTYPTLT